MENNTINLAFTSDEKYTTWIGILLISILENTGSDVHAYICTDGNPSEQTTTRFDLICLKYKNITITWVNILEYRTVPFENFGRWNVNIFDRLYLPDIINGKKALYIDSDFIFEADIRRLWEEDIDGYEIAAVREIGMQVRLRTDKLLRNYFYEIGLTDTSRYFNSGLLLINLELCRSTGVLHRVLEFCHDHPELKWPDQDGLNIIAGSSCKELDYSWNVQIYQWRVRKSRVLTLLEKGYLNAAFACPKGIHYSGDVKPWDSSKVVKFGNRYKKYYRISPWKNDIRSFSWKKIVHFLYVFSGSIINFGFSNIGFFLNVLGHDVVGTKGMSSRRKK